MDSKIDYTSKDGYNLYYSQKCKKSSQSEATKEKKRWLFLKHTCICGLQRIPKVCD